MQYKCAQSNQTATSNEAAAHAYLAAIRWKNERTCAYCRSDNTKVVTTEKHRFHCNDCRKRFSARTGTIFADSRVALWKWLSAISFVTTAPDGITSLELAKKIRVKHQTAIQMLIKLRASARTYSFTGPLDVMPNGSRVTLIRSVA